jgi:DNA topoisomerase-1
VKLICKAASERLHNTPAVCRSSYIHPAVLALADDISPVERLLKNELELPQLRGLRTDERRLLAVLKSSSLQTQTGAAADPLQRWRAAAAEA